MASTSSVPMQPNQLQQSSTRVAEPRSRVVSVITIFWNAAPFLVEAIESLLAQTYTDWELLLVDDGSTDGGPEIADGYVSRHPGRIRHLSHPDRMHLGTAASRNLGLSAATGEYIAFLDADDVYLPRRLEEHVRVLQAVPSVDMVQSEHIKWHTWVPGKGALGEMLARPLVAVGERMLAPPEGLLTMLAVPSMVPGICDVTVRSEVARQLGYIDPSFRLHFEDQIFISKVYLEKVVCLVPCHLALYRRHPLSNTIRFQETTAVFDRQATAAMRSFYEWLRNYVAARGVAHPLLSEFLSDRVEYSASWGAAARRAAALLITRGKRALRAVGAARLYRQVLRWEHRLSCYRARRRYLGLCRRISYDAARVAGARRIDE